MSSRRLATCPGMIIGGVGLLAIAASPAYAQSFCPPGFAQANGFCTNGVTGAFSSAALSSSALTEVSTSVTQQSANTTSEAIRGRREEEQRRAATAPTAPRQTTAARPAREAAPAPEPAPARERRVAPARGAVAIPYYKAPPLGYGPRNAVWLQAFGDWERFKTSTVVSNTTDLLGGGGGGVGGGGVSTPSSVDVTRKITTVGFVAGSDWTFRNVAAGGDLLIAGLLTGYEHADATFDATTTSSNTAVVPNGSSTLKAKVEGPSLGAFSTYSYAAFSADITFKVDFLSVNESFSELLGFSAVPGGAGPTLVPFSGGGSTRALNYVTFGNVNYRIPISLQAWWEPTAGFRFTYTDYDDASAKALGLADGHILRVQGGARIGADYRYYNVHVTPVLTGLVYSDTVITGGALQNGAFLGPGFIAHADEGKVRFQGIGTLNFDHLNGFKTFVEANVRAGREYFGAGGRGGIRYEW